MCIRASAEILHEEGSTISGSDSKESDLTKTLAAAAAGAAVTHVDASKGMVTWAKDCLLYTSP